MYTNKDIRARARYLLDENIFGKDWMKSLGFAVFFSLISGALTYFISLVVGFISGLLPSFLESIGVEHYIFYIFALVIAFVLNLLAIQLVVGPLNYSFYAAHLDFSRGDSGFHVSKVFSGFKDFIGNVQLSIMYVLHVFLWSLLFIIPGIYVMYSYRMIYHVKHDNPELSWKDCFDESERLMDGNRWRLFKLDCSFIGWMLLGFIAGCGIGMFWVYPYLYVSDSVFYDVIKAEKEEYDY